LAQELPEDGTAVPKHVAVITDCTVVYSVGAFRWSSNRKRVIKMDGVSNFKSGKHAVLPV